MNDLIKELKELLTLIEKASDEDFSGLDERYKKIKHDLKGWFIDDFQLYQAS